MLEYKYNKESIQKELKKIKNNPGNFLKLPNTNKIVLTYQPHFYEKEKELFSLNPIIRRKLIENRCNFLDKEENELTDKEILRGFKISGIYYGFSHFSPFWIKAFIEKYNIKSIYDPCGGWGHRLLGAYNIKYIYNDINIKTFNGVNNIIRDFNIQNKITYNNDSSLFTPEEDYECVFTCPPYYNTEVYEKPFLSFKEYIYWWHKTINKSLKKPVKYFVFVIDNKLKEYLKICCIDKHMIFVEEIKLGRKKSHFQKQINNNEFLVIYKTS